MRADRLLSILMLLQARGRMTAHDLAVQLEVSERTIYRDLEALGIAGVPVYTERGPGGGCGLVEGYQTRLTGLTDFEVRALFLAHLTTPVADLGLDQALDQAMLKLSAALPASSRENAEQAQGRIHFDASGWYHRDTSRDFLQVMQGAVWQDRKLSLTYVTDDGGERELVIEAFGLVAKAGVWYLVGSMICQIHVLRVAHIQQVIALEEHFERPTDFHLAGFWSEYCMKVEANSDQYAMALQLAPEDASHIHETLSNWGYRLIENEEYLLLQKARQQAVRNVFPSRRKAGLQKKAIVRSVETRRPVRKKEKKALYDLQKKPFGQKKNTFGTSKKRKTSLHPIKKRAFSATQKKAFCQPSKKSIGMIQLPLALPLCA